MSSIKPEPNPLPETRPTTGRDYWRSLEEYAQTPEFQDMIHREFPSMAPDVVSDTSRREFLKIMGASLGMAGMTGCMWPQEKILPFAERPEGRMPGIPVFYATGMEVGGVGRGLLAKSFDGRPVKIEGNPQHPESQGSSDVISQSVILEVYDPDRSRSVVEVQGEAEFTRSWSEFASAAGSVMNTHRSRNGAGLAVVAEATSSPTMAALRAQWMEAFPESDWVEWEAVDRDNERAGTRAAFGSVLRPHYRFNRADVIASFDEDFLTSHPASVRYAFDFVEGRKSPAGKGHGGHDDHGSGNGHSDHGDHGNADAHGHAGDMGQRKGQFNRLYAVESCYSPTGGMADHRLPVAPSEVTTVLGELAAELFLGSGLTSAALDGAIRSRLQAFRQGGKHAAFVKQMAKELMEHRRASVVAVGPRQPASAHALGYLINEALGNVGETILFTADPSGDRPSFVNGLSDLVGKMNSGRVDTVLILGGNPVFDAPGDLGVAEALAKVGTRIHLGLHANETSAACNWRLPRAHFLEAWGDSRGWDGTLTVTQPLIRPLYDGRSAIEVVSTLMNGFDTSGYDLVREQLGASNEDQWRRTLHDGLVAGSAFSVQTPTVGGASLNAALASLAPHEAAASTTAIEVSFAPDPAVYDGRFANNAWLQELPDLLTKLAWDNALLLGVSTANAMGLSDGDVVSLEKDGRSIEIPIWTTPGQAQGSGHLYFGRGRKVSGKVGTDVGHDVNPLRGTSAWHQAAGVKVTKTGTTSQLVSTQDHFAIDETGQKATASRLGALVQEATVEDYASGNIHHHHHPPALPLWDAHEYNGNKWGMTVDLNACTGCNACVIACQSENNIPVVGKDEVAMGREMHWLRVDRYFRGDPDDPDLVLQPVMCLHCENAPCEQVCPVAATVHSSEGLNDMVYNRCIGTRYCANNCPYKVRRFNFFNYNGGMSSVEKMRANPDVTMRARGVMEKCTFCTQRISQVKIQAKNERRPIEDGEIRTACEQACPTNAITFGNLNDLESRVAKLQDDGRAYGMLDGHLHTKPRLKYLKRLRNPAAELIADADGHGHGDHH